MKAFTRDDGQILRVVDGFGYRILHRRPSKRPKPDWSDTDYAAAAESRTKRWKKRLSRMVGWGVRLDGARILEVCCGAGIECLLMSLEPVRQVIGIDMRLSLFDQGAEGERSRRLAGAVLDRAGFGSDIAAALQSLPIRFANGDVTRMAFADDSFDLVVSHAALEHVIPIDKALAEMARVLRPGGLMFHSIDPSGSGAAIRPAW